MQYKVCIWQLKSALTPRIIMFQEGPEYGRLQNNTSCIATVSLTVLYRSVAWFIILLFLLAIVCHCRVNKYDYRLGNGWHMWCIIHMILVSCGVEPCHYKYCFYELKLYFHCSVPVVFRIWSWLTLVESLPTLYPFCH